MPFRVFLADQSHQILQRLQNVFRIKVHINFAAFGFGKLYHISGGQLPGIFQPLGKQLEENSHVDSYQIQIHTVSGKDRIIMNLIVQGADIGKLGVNLLQILPAAPIRGNRCALKGIQGCVCAENGVSYIGIQDTQKHMFGVFQVLDFAIQFPAVHKKISFSYQGRAKNPKCSDDCN